MKRLSTLVLVIMLLVFVLASCGGNDTPAHEHSFASNWTADATGHWHGATCEHTTEKADFAAHTDADGNGKCDACAYVIFTRDTVTVNAPEGVTVSENLTAKTGTDLVFTASVSNNYLLFAEGADFVEKKVEGDTATYSFKVTSVNAESEVTITKERYVFVDELLTGEGSFTDVVAWNTTVGEDITVSFDKAGTFYIYADNPDVSFNDMPVLEVVIEEPGEMTFATSIYSYDALDELAYNYYVVEAETVIVIDEGGEYVLPSNMEVVLQYTAPEKGWYDITFDSDEYEYMANNGKIVYADKDSIIETAIIAYAEYLPEYATGYSMSWGVEKLVATTVVAGDNTVNMDSNTSKLISFTAPEDGAYSFVLTLDSNMFKYWDYYEDLEGNIVGYVASTDSVVYITPYLCAGETIEILVSNTTKEYNEDTDEYELIDCEITDTLTITNIGYNVVPDNNGTTGMVDADGFMNTIYNDGDEETTYYVNVGEDALIGIEGEDGEMTWVSSYDFVIGAGEFTSFLIKSEVEEAVEIDIVAKAVVYEIYTSFGNNYAYDIIPGKSYTLVINEMLGMMNPYIFTWDNENVSIYVSGMPIESGVAFEYGRGAEFTLVNNGTTEQSVEFSFVDPMGQGELVIGNNSINIVYINGFARFIDMSFTVPGMYVLTPAEGEENLFVLLKGETEDVEVTLPYEFTVAEDTPVTFAISSTLVGTPDSPVNVDTVEFTIENKFEPFFTAPSGAYKVVDQYGMTHKLTFQPVEGKNYGAVDVELVYPWGDSETTTYKYALNMNNLLVLWDEDNNAYDEYSFVVDKGGNWGIILPGTEMPIALEPISDVDYTALTEELVGTAWLDDNSTYVLEFSKNMVGQYVGRFYDVAGTVIINFSYAVTNYDDWEGYMVSIIDAYAEMGDINLFNGVPGFGNEAVCIFPDFTGLVANLTANDTLIQYWFDPKTEA